MTALVIIGLVVVIGVAVSWSRVGLARSERKSMQDYEHALHVLGDVAKRSDAAARIRPVRREDADHGYIRTEQSGTEPSSEREDDPVEPAKPRVEGVPAQFEDDSDAFERAQEEAARETVVTGGWSARARSVSDSKRVGSQFETPQPTEPPPVPRKSPSEPTGEPARLPAGRAVTAAAAVLIVVALVLVGINLTGGKAPRSAASNRHHHHSHPAAPATTTAPTTTAPTALVPVSTSPQQVAFVAPKGDYNLLLTDTGGPCWVGIQQTAGGPYVFQETLSAGQSATYKATGPLVIDIGAPKYLGVKVNGLPARLPGYVQPYELVFNPSTPPSSA